MKWASSDVEREHRPTWWRLPADVRGNHHQLIVACSFYENGGAFRGCKGWHDRDWWATTGVHRSSLDRLGRFGVIRWTDDGDTLVVEHYDTQHEAKAQASRALGAKLAKLRWDAYAARIAGRSAGRSAPSSADSNANGKASGSAGRYAPGPAPGPGPSDPIPNTDLEEIPDPLPKGGAGGNRRGERGGGRGAPHGATAETGPEGFERFWARLLKKGGEHEPTWRDRTLQWWASLDCEGEADEIIRYYDHQRRSAQWKQRGPEGQAHHFVPTPWNLLRAGRWRKKGPWTMAPPQPDHPPEVVAAVAELEREEQDRKAWEEHKVIRDRLIAQGVPISEVTARVLEELRQ